MICFTVSHYVYPAIRIQFKILEFLTHYPMRQTNLSDRLGLLPFPNTVSTLTLQHRKLLIMLSLLLCIF
jgi:hypothetical protein